MSDATVANLRECSIWDRYHGISLPSSTRSNAGNTSGNAKKDGAHSIFTDEDPATTIKGCGFKNMETALQTLVLIEQPRVRYKQYWTVRAMMERAERHPVMLAMLESSAGKKQTPSCGNTISSHGMVDAIRVFRSWFYDRQLAQGEQTTFDGTSDISSICLSPVGFSAASSKPVSNAPGPCMSRPSDEWSHRSLLANSRVNRHNMMHCKTEAELIRVARQDKTEAIQALRVAAIEKMSLQHGKRTGQEICEEQIRHESTAVSGSSISPTASNGSRSEISGAGSSFSPGPWFAFSGPALVSLFGGPGVHGYGTHVCMLASASAHPAEVGQCVCGFGNRDPQKSLSSTACNYSVVHQINVRATALATTSSVEEEQGGTNSQDLQRPAWLTQLMNLVGLHNGHPVVDRELKVLKYPQGKRTLADPGGLASLNLGKKFPFTRFSLEWRSRSRAGGSGSMEELLAEEARFTFFEEALTKSLSSQVPGVRQPSVLEFFAVRAAKRPRKDAESLQGEERCQDRTIVLSSSEDE